MHVGKDFSDAKYILELALSPHAYISYSQFGEDLLIDIFFHSKTTPGFYVDVGAHHPERFSNTHLLYQRGWRGINIEGDEQLIKAFVLARPEDKNITAFVSDHSSSAIFNRFNETAVNTISDEKAQHYSERWNIVSSETIQTSTLKELLTSHLPVGQEIDLLSVDVEGLDLQVLKGNDWTLFRPKLVLVEIDDLDLMRAAEHPIVIFMKERQYALKGLLHVSAFFLRVN